jgi:hypothetical protein
MHYARCSKYIIHGGRGGVIVGIIFIYYNYNTAHRALHAYYTVVPHTHVPRPPPHRVLLSAVASSRCCVLLEVKCIIIKPASPWLACPRRYVSDLDSFSTPLYLYQPDIFIIIIL